MEFIPDDNGEQMDDDLDGLSLPNVDFDALEAELGGEIVLESDSHAMHTWMAAMQVLYRLEPKALIDRLNGMNELTNPEKAQLEMQKAREEGKESFEHFIDTLGDVSKIILTELEAHLTGLGMPNATFLVFLPCHGGLGT